MSQRYFEEKEERRMERRDRLRVLFGMAEFGGVVLGVVVIFVLLALLISLVNWLAQDIAGTFTILSTRF